MAVVDLTEAMARRQRGLAHAVDGTTPPAALPPQIATVVPRLARATALVTARGPLEAPAAPMRLLVGICPAGGRHSL